MSNEARRSALQDDWLLLILSSPSGAGKTTLKNRLLGEFSQLHFAVSHTTRPPRTTEKDGREYHFVSQDTFRQMVSAGRFAEHAEVHSNLYGTSVDELERARSGGKSGVIFDIDYQGARQIRARFPQAVTVFILPPSMDELERRLRGRADEGEASILRRLHNAQREIENYGFFDYLIVNDNIEKALGELRAVVLAERAKRSRRGRLAEFLLANGPAPSHKPQDLGGATNPWRPTSHSLRPVRHWLAFTSVKQDLPPLETMV